MTTTERDNWSALDSWRISVRDAAGIVETQSYDNKADAEDVARLLRDYGKPGLTIWVERWLLGAWQRYGEIISTT